MTPAVLPSLFGRAVRHIHCVGAGGMGVAPLAVYLRQLGFVVSGEDDAMTDDVRELLLREHVTVDAIPDGCELVVRSSAIASSHPTCVLAAARGVPQVRRGEMLAEIVRGRKLVAICGSHGKTTTTAMLITALRRASFPAGYVLGGLFADGTSPAQAGGNDWVVAEIDESDGTIAEFSPEIAVAVNLDWDHPDQYRQLADFERAFAALFERTRGTVLVSDACAVSTRICRGAVASVSGKPTDGEHLAALRSVSDSSPPDRRPQFGTFGRSGDFGFGINAETAGRMELRLSGRFSIEAASLRARGEFNAANATAALATAQLMGVTLAPDLLAEFPGVRRRQAVLHDARGILVIEDYAHHPGEIQALLVSLREQAATRRGRLLVVFQPHRFSRTAQFKREFAASLIAADALSLLEVYAAGERAVPGGTTADLAAELRRIAPQLPLSFEPGDEALVLAELSRTARAGDLIAFVGAGDIDRKARAWVEQWRSK